MQKKAQALQHECCCLRCLHREEVGQLCGQIQGCGAGTVLGAIQQLDSELRSIIWEMAALFCECQDLFNVKMALDRDCCLQETLEGEECHIDFGPIPLQLRT